MANFEELKSIGEPVFENDKEPKGKDVMNSNLVNSDVLNHDFKCELVPIELNKIDVSDVQTISISDIGKLGALSIPVINVIQNVMGSGGSGLYMVNTAGGTLFKSAVKGGFIGGVRNAAGGISQATLSPVIFNPITLGVALTLVSVFIKLDKIESSCNKIYDYITISDKAELSNNYKILFKIYNEYRENFNNEKAVSEFIHSISSINSNSGKMIEVYKTLIEKELGKNKFNLNDKSVINNSKELISNYYYLKLAAFNYAFSTMLTIFIEEKFNHDTLERCYKDINEKTGLVEDLFYKTKNYLLNQYDKSLTNKHLFIIELSREMSSKIPGIKDLKFLNDFNEKQIEEKVIEINNGRDYIEKVFADNQELDIGIYNKNIKFIDQVFNSQTQILCDANNFYVKAEIEE